MLAVNVLPDLVKSEALEINKYHKRDDPHEQRVREYNEDDLSSLEEELATSEEVTGQESSDCNEIKPKVKRPKENPYLV